MATYSFMDVVATIVGPGGAFPLASDAGASDEGVTIAMREDVNTMVVGADGSVMHSLHAGKGGEIRVRLLKTSPTNAMLTAMYQLQRLSSASHGQNLFSLVDKSRGDIYVCRQVAFKKYPDNTYGKDAGMLEWTFDAGYIDPILGAGIPDLTQ